METVDDTPGIGAKLRYLQTTLAPAGIGQPVRRIETHMSWLLLGGERVLKLKKPVRYPFLDFTTVQARERNARAELRLNRRLAPRVYLGLLALQWDDGVFSLVPEEMLPAPGRTVDWLVSMQRLPAARMLDRVIARSELQQSEIDALLEVLAPFYRDAPRAAFGEDEYLQRLRDELAASRSVLAMPRFDLPQVHSLLDRMDRAVAMHEDMLRARVRGRHIGCVRRPSRRRRQSCTSRPALRPGHYFVQHRLQRVRSARAPRRRPAHRRCCVCKRRPAPGRYRWMFRLAADPKRWVSVTAPLSALSAFRPACLSRKQVSTRCTTGSTGVSSCGCAASSRRNGNRHRQHPLAHRHMGMTWWTRCAAVCAMRRAPHEGQKPRRLQEKATSLSWTQPPQRSLRKPYARMPHSKKASNSSFTNCGRSAPAATSTSAKKVAACCCTRRGTAWSGRWRL